MVGEFDAVADSTRHVIIDTDIGVDDAWALVMALRSRRWTVEAITCVAGNTTVDNVVQNALYVRDLCDARVPVYRGAAKPLTRRLQVAPEVHGSDGLGDVGLPLRGRSPENLSAAVTLVTRTRELGQMLDLVALGPLTNIALACMLDDGFASRIGNCVVMGGAWMPRGNASPVAEFNIWCDPEAADIVFASGMNMTLVPWETCVECARIEEGDFSRWEQIHSRSAEFLLQIMTVARAWGRSRPEGVVLPDALAMAIALEGEVAVACETAPIVVETGNGLARGQTILVRPADATGGIDVSGRGPVTVVTRGDRARFARHLEDTVE